MTTNAPPVFIAGFHRSGTSAVALALRNAGLDLGTNLLGAEPSNPYGHFEDVEVISAHDAALRSRGLTWKATTVCNRPLPALRSHIASYAAARSQQVAQGSSWGIKDPRLCLFLDEWLDLCPEAVVVVVFRAPGDAISSLHRRHAQRYVDSHHIDPSDLAFWQNPDLGLQLWIHYHEQLLASLPTSAKVHAIDFANRDSILQAPTALRDAWGIALETSNEETLDPTLGTSGASTIEIRDLSLISHAEALWRRLQQLVSSGAATNR